MKRRQFLIGAATSALASGWKFFGFRRTYGLKYVDNVTSPDGRKATFESFEMREGNPVALLTDDEQDRLDDIFEAAEVRT